MNWRKAKHRTWRLPVIWDTGDEPLTAVAEVVPQVTVNHFHGGHHLHLTHGGDAAGLGPALPPGNAITEGES